MKKSTKNHRPVKKSTKLKFNRPIYKSLSFWLTVLLFGCVGSYFLAQSRAAEFNYLTTHPQAAEGQLTSRGAPYPLSALQAWNNKLYASYIYTDVKKTMALNPYDPTTNTFLQTPEAYASAEAIYRFYEDSGKIYAVHFDPMSGGSDFTIGKIDPATGGTTWSGRRPVNMSHVFGFTRHGNELCMAGSQGANAVVYCGTDDGPWRLIYSEAPLSTEASRGAWFVYLVSYNGKLYTQGFDTYANITHTAKVFDGTKWVDGPSLIPFGFDFDGAFVDMFGGKPILKTSTSLVSFNGTTTTTHLTGVNKAVVADDGYVYAQMTDARIMRSNDLTNWEMRGLSPASSDIYIWSMEIMNGKIYLGDTRGRIYVADNTPYIDKTPPTASIINPISDNYLISRGRFSFGVSARDEDAVSRVEFFLDGNLIGTVTNGGTSGQYYYQWDSRGYAKGAHKFTATAYDKTGNAASAGEKTIYVGEIIPTPDIDDAIAPTVSITSPADGTQIKDAQIVIAASATDNISVARIEILVGGVQIYNGTSSSVNKRFKTNVMPRGEQMLVVNAYDANGNKGSKSIMVNVL